MFCSFVNGGRMGERAKTPLVWKFAAAKIQRVLQNAAGDAFAGSKVSAARNSSQRQD
jgi:hypothetical protein